MREEKQYSEML